MSGNPGKIFLICLFSFILYKWCCFRYGNVNSDGKSSPRRLYDTWSSIWHGFTSNCCCRVSISRQKFCLGKFCWTVSIHIQFKFYINMILILFFCFAVIFCLVDRALSLEDHSFCSSSIRLIAVSQTEYWMNCYLLLLLLF